MKTDYNYELIKDCLDGILDSKTTEKIKRLIESDKTARDIAKGILLLEDRFENDKDLNAYLNDLHTRQEKIIEGISQTKKPFTFLKIAASVTILAISALVAYQINRPTLSDLLSAELSIPYQSATTVRNSEEISDFEKAMIAYNKGEYAKTIELLKEEQDSQAIFFKGLSLLFAEEYSMAIEFLGKPELIESRYEEQSRWYQSLAYLKSNQNQKASEILGEIVSNKDHFKHKEALKLLEYLN
ncbi:MAG: hypothetical protein ABJG78_14620 [Cyclobacteriaceae bacterium]